MVLAFEERLFEYQWTWYRAMDQRSRMILKVVRLVQLTTLHLKL